MIRVLYAGSPKASSLTLEKLIENSKNAENGFEIAGVLTNPPSAQGRHKTLIPTPVENVARENNIPVFAPEHLDSSAREEVSKINADILVCFAYGHIFGPKFMSLFRFGGINLHPSSLPKYRGPSPVNAAILNLDDETAFSIQKVSEKMDEGNLLAQEKIALTKKETAGTLLNDAAIWGGTKFTEILRDISKNNAISEGKPQSSKNESATYTKMIKKEDAKIAWNKTAEEIDGIVRAYNPEPCAWTSENGNPLKIIEGFPLTKEEAFSALPKLQKELNNLSESEKVPGKVVAFSKSKGILVLCKKGFYAITKLQRQGKNPMDYKSFMNGARDFAGCVLR